LYTQVLTTATLLSLIYWLNLGLYNIFNWMVCTVE
jgi:hypothetical protein